MLAIHAVTGSFQHGWIEYCKKNDIAFKEVDCFSDDIIDQLRGCSALLWHWEHHDYRAALFARQLIASAEAMGLAVFPGTGTCWHYDDKVGQKYLLEAVGAPLIPSHVFYDREAALAWLQNAEFPMVWKLRGGAGSQNVKLIRSLREARRIVRRSFGRGWSNARFHALKDRMWQFRRDRNVKSFLNIGRGLARAANPHDNDAHVVRQKDYVYFQEFVPGNDFDIRVIIIGKRAFAIKRMVREGDFRASGSGKILYEKDEIPIECIEISFDVTRNIKSQCCAFDFVYDNDSWRIVEISYAFSLHGYRDCPGHWDRNLVWHAGFFAPEEYMVEDLLTRLEKA